MNQFEEVMQMIEARCGHDKDNIISLATLSFDTATSKSVPAVRDVDAYYENGVFYVVTHAKSNKMIEIDQNENIAFSVNFENISGTAIGKNLGWVLDPKNASLREKMRRVFAKWYDEANNEQDVNFCYLAIEITKARVVTGHGPNMRKFNIDLVNKRLFDEVKEMVERDAYYFTFKGKEAKREGRAYIFKWLSENQIDLLKEKGPIFIFGSYDIFKKEDEAFEYTLYMILPKHIKLLVKPSKKKIFGGIYARRFTTFEQLESETQDLKTTFINDKRYDANHIIYEQYLLENHCFSNDTRILLVLDVSEK